LISHIAKHFKLDPTDYEILSDLFSAVDAMCANLPLRFRDLLCVYETFPAFGEFMFPKNRSHLWQLVESTDSPLLLTDSLVSGKEGLFICQAIDTATMPAAAERILEKLSKPTMCINHRNDVSALLYPLISI
jgi:hypothetical protein